MWTFFIICTALPLTTSPPAKFYGFKAALVLLTRFVLSSPPADDYIAAGLPWHGFVGLLIGLLATLLAIGLVILIPVSGIMWLAGWVWIGVEMWISRGLHWDGVADLGDALGSGATGSRFRQILKDSRMGAFGTMALILVLALQATAAGLHFSQFPALNSPAALLALIFAPAWARLGPVWLAFGSAAYTCHSLGAQICANVTLSLWLFSWILAIIILTACLLTGLPPLQAFILLLAQICLNWRFRHIARLQGGLSGDFLGCHIELSQTLFLILTIA